MSQKTALRALMVTPRYAPSVGGVETHVQQVALRLARSGVQVTVLTTDPTRTLPAQECTSGVTIERVPAWPEKRDYFFAPAIYQRVLQGRWDIVHCQSYHTFVAPIAMLAARRAKLPYVVTFHGGGHSSPWRRLLRRPQWLLLRPLLARAERLIAIARFEIELYGKFLRLPRERFTLIPNGCELEAAPPDVTVASSEPLIVSVGRLERYKGHHRAIEALPYLLAQRPNARLRIVGSGPYEEALRQLARKLGVAERVEIGGIPATERRAMAELLARASLVVLLSAYETHPIAALEALAAGRPVLVAGGSGLSELAERGQARAVPLRSSPAQVAAAMLEQLQDPLIPTRLKLPTWDDCAAGLLDLYRSVATRPVCAS